MGAFLFLSGSGSVVTYSGTSFAEAVANDGSITATVTGTLVGDTFVTTGALTENTHYSVSGVPSGLTFVVTADTTTAFTLSFTGNAASHANANDTSITLTWLAAGFTLARLPAPSTKIFSIDFADPSYTESKAWRLNSGSDQYIKINHHASLSLSDNFSFEFIVNVPQVLAANQFIITKRDAAGSSLPYQMYINTSGKFVVYVNNAGTDKNYISAATITGGEHQLGCTFAGGTLKMFVDGVDVTAGATKSIDDAMVTVGTNTEHIVIGRLAHDGSGVPLEGKVCRAGIYSTVLSEANYATLWGGGTPADTTLGTAVMNLKMEADDTVNANGILDTSGNANHGSAQNMTSANLVNRTYTLSTHSAVLNGSDEEISYGDVLNKSNTDAWTLSIWLEPANTTQTSVFPAAKLDAGVNDFAGWEIVQDTTTVEWWLLKTFTGSKYIKKTVASMFAANTRVHLAISMNGASTAAGITIYKNGVAQSATDVTDGLDGTTTTTAPMRVGARYVTAAGHWAGKADGFAIINAGLTAAQIRELYNGGKAASVSEMTFRASAGLDSLIGEAGDTFEAGSGVLDLSGNNRHGTATNMTNASNKSTDIT